MSVLINKKILFVHFGQSSFVKEDLKILTKAHTIHEFYYNVKKSKWVITTTLAYLITFAKQTIWLLRHTPRADLIYCWFADFHAFIPALFSKIFNIPLLVVIGGVDGVSNNELKYGVFASKWRAPLSRFIINHANCLLPVDDSLIEATSVAKYWGEAYPNGIKYHMPNLNTNWEKLPTGYNSGLWEMGPGDRPKRVLTVALINSIKRFRIKGIDLLLKSSFYLPDYSFTIIGVTNEMRSFINKEYNLGNNVTLLPPLDREDLVSHYKKASIYAQLSRSEGLPNVLCEAMLCGCVPVGSPVFGIPKAILVPELIVYKPYPKLVADTIIFAHEKFNKQRLQFRDHIHKNFALELREQKLLSLIDAY
ncbi:MAG: glycosyltransferase family 4 protein [Bacteroidetes bacterium]|nr:glycosyltransferase family 4 protein [Bacteroidota bacterium]